MDGLGALWCSNYGDTNPIAPPRTAYELEGGNHHSGWIYPLGDRRPDLLQYSSRGVVAGHANVDLNAFRGSRAELESIFYGRARRGSNEEELTMADIQRILDHIDRKAEEIKRYVDVRITDPIGSDVKDIRQQLTGGRDKVLDENGRVDLQASYPGWAQLGQDENGLNLTVVDALAAMRHEMVALARPTSTNRKDK